MENFTDNTNQNEAKLALITGASRGIGEAIARKLASVGYDLVLTCKSSFEDLGALANELKETYNIECVCKRVDAGNFSEVKELFEETVFERQGLDVLVNNAGISYIGLLHEMKEDEWQAVMNADLNSVFYHSKFAIPLMLRKHSGRIVNISSVWGNVGASTEVAYSAAKGGVNSFTKALAKELASSGITVNAVACGLIDTKMNECFSEEDLAGVIEEIPADRIGKPEEVAETVSLLLDAPDYLTGQIITMDGGWT